MLSESSFAKSFYGNFTLSLQLFMLKLDAVRLNFL